MVSEDASKSLQFLDADFPLKLRYFILQERIGNG